MRRQFTTRERIGVITESGFSAEGLKLSSSPRAMRALEELVSVLCDMVLGQREQIERVRERAELRFGIPAVQGTYQAGYAAAMNDILRSLEGDSDE